MRVPAFLVRVLSYVKLSPRTRVQPEDAMCVRFANALRAATLDDRLRGVWCHPANELCHGHRTGVRAAISRAMGMHVGIADYLFQWADGSGALEAKVGANGLTPGQDAFRAWCEREGVRHRTFKSVAEGLAILREWGVLTGPETPDETDFKPTRPPRTHRESGQMHREVIAALAEGEPSTSIAQRYGIAPSTVRNIAKRGGLPARPRGRRRALETIGANHE